MAAHRTSFPLWKGTCTEPRNFSLYLSIHSLLFSAWSVEATNQKKSNISTGPDLSTLNKKVWLASLWLLIVSIFLHLRPCSSRRLWPPRWRSKPGRSPGRPSACCSPRTSSLLTGPPPAGGRPPPAPVRRRAGGRTCEATRTLTLSSALPCTPSVRRATLYRLGSDMESLVTGGF